MNLSSLQKLFEKNQNFIDFIHCIQSENISDIKLNIIDEAKPFFFSCIYRKLNLPCLVITSDLEQASNLFNELQSWVEHTESLYLYPEIINSNYQNSSGKCKDIEILNNISKVIDSLQNYSLGKNSGSIYSPYLIIASFVGVMNKLISPSEYHDFRQIFKIGNHIKPVDVINKFNNMGYSREDVVEVPGDFSQRGGIIDIFPINSELPVRVELAGNEIYSMRLFDPRTQKSKNEIDEIIIPVAKICGDYLSSSTIFNYLAENTILIIDNYENIKNKYERLISSAEFNNDIDNFRLPDYLSENYNLFYKSICNFKKRIFFDFYDSGAQKFSLNKKSPFSMLPRYGGKLDEFIRALKRQIEGGYSIFIISQQTERLYELLLENNITARKILDNDNITYESINNVILIKGYLQNGWMFEDAAVLYTDNEIFGILKQCRTQKKRHIRHHLFVDELSIGDYVVHIDHGIGKFLGLTKLNNDGNKNEYLLVEYAAGDKLYVPINQIDRLSRYFGASENPPSLSRLHTQEWAHTKRRIKESIRKIAEELLNLYAERQIISGFAFSPDCLWQRELESSFPFIETPDQLQAVYQVKKDMETNRPMDRLICGDVGYGKTEIAIRAAFKAVMDNKQVAVLVPTTILAQQHYLTFNERLRAFPVKLSILSRFSSKEEQTQVIQGLSNGSIDICIGTHRLLQKDIEFKNLGLLIIDEEQRFGVVHKEHFKKLRREIDVLTLSATPIPRTLHMSLSGLKDLSTLETPPEDRLPIKTYVAPYSDSIVKEAIIKEIMRGGQVFYVHNRIHNINLVANRLQFLIPFARIAVAHGKMPEDELEEVMMNFILHRSDVLLTTTIIESGIDIPNVNTLVVDDSDNLGLTQMYQLRGRIGRGSNKAYAYFLFDSRRQLTDSAYKRLKTIAEATELGAGFAIAMKDLEIRGAGNLLGIEQSGYISAVGFDLYCKLLNEAIEEFKHKKEHKSEMLDKLEKSSEVAISLNLDAYIPDNYIASPITRIEYYKKLANVQSINDIYEIKDDIRDRFGILPEEVVNLLYIVEIKLMASNIGLESVCRQNNQVILYFRKNENLEKLKFITDNCHYLNDVIRVGIRQIKIGLDYKNNNWKDILRNVIGILSSNRIPK